MKATKMHQMMELLGVAIVGMKLTKSHFIGTIVGCTLFVVALVLTFQIIVNLLFVMDW